MLRTKLQLTRVTYLYSTRKHFHGNFINHIFIAQALRLKGLANSLKNKELPLEIYFPTRKRTRSKLTLHVEVYFIYRSRLTKAHRQKQAI